MAYFMDRSKPWGSACNSDGTLKDAKDVDFSELAVPLAVPPRQFQFVAMNPSGSKNAIAMPNNQKKSRWLKDDEEQAAQLKNES
jgi:hypothetical protein